MHNSDMRRFVSYIGIYVLLVIAIILPIEIYRMHISADDEKVPGSEVRYAEKLSKKKINKKIKKLILGDSTGHALYPCEKEYDEVVSLACNRAITLAGHYFLLKNFIETNPDNLPQEIIVLYTPFSFSCDLDQYAYQYFLKPFPRKEYQHLYTDHLSQRVKSIPLYWTANWPFIHTSGYTPRMAIPASGRKAYMSELSIEYLHKMDSIAKVFDIPIRFCSSPVREDRENEVKKFTEEICQLSDSIVVRYIKQYVESIKFYPSDLFEDDVHLYDKEVPIDYLNLFEE